MKKIRRIISVILAAIMIMSTWTLCFIASAEGAAESLTPIAEMWEFDDTFSITSGTTATLANGPFSLYPALNAEVTNDENGVASLFGTNGVRYFSSSEDGIIDIAPGAQWAESRIVFTAPEAGTYYFRAHLVKTDMTGHTGTIQNWTQIGATQNSSGVFNSGWGWSGFQIGDGSTNSNGSTFALTEALHSATVTLAAGQCITISVGGEGTSYDTYTTVKTFKVVKINGSSVKDDFSCSTTVKDDGNFRLMGTAYGTGDVDLLEGTARNTYWDTSGKYFTWYGAANIYWDYNNGTSTTSTKYPYFATSQCGGVLDAAPLLGTKSIVQYTADKTGIYSFSGTFTKIAWGDGVTSQVSVFKNTSEELVAPQTSADKSHIFNVSGDVLLNKGDTVWFVVETTDGGGSTEVGINSLSVTYLGCVPNVSAEEYLALEGGSAMWLILNDVGKLSDGEVYTIDGNPMFWSDKYTAYCYLKIANNEAEALSSELAVAYGTPISVDYGMDVNMSGAAEVNDAQLVYNMYNVEDDVDYTNFDSVSMEKFLRADVTGDGKIDTSDVSLILSVYAYDYEPDSDEPVTQQVPMWIAHGYDRVDPSTTKPSNASTNYTVYMAKNEDEGVSIALRSDTAWNSLSIKPLSGENADIEWKAYYARPVTIGTLGTYTDALIPLDAHGYISLTAGNTTAIYLDFKSSSDTPAGDYPYEFALIDANDNVLSTVEITVHVWDFELYSGTLHNELNIPIFETAVQKLEKGIMANPVDHYEFLLDYGLCAYDLPYDILDDRADAYMSDPRVTSFRVPHDVDDATLQAYYAKLLTNAEWLKKAYFYPVDEPDTLDELKALATWSTKLKSLCSEIRITSPYFVDDNYFDWDSYTTVNQTTYMDQYIDLHCPKLALWANSGFGDKMSNAQANGEKLWSYVCNEPNGSGYLNLTIDDASLGHRVLFWQFYQRDIEGFLYWGVNTWMLTDPWEDLGLLDYEDYYGDGILTYPGNDYDLYYGQLLPSVRLVAVRDGLEDIEYMYMAKALLGETTVDQWAAEVATSSSVTWNNNISSDNFAALRIEIGNAIEQALNNQ